MALSLSQLQAGPTRTCQLSPFSLKMGSLKPQVVLDAGQIPNFDRIWYATLKHSEDHLWKVWKVSVKSGPHKHAKHL